MKTFLAPLSPEEEQQCFQRLGDGDLSAKDELILHNMRLVAHVAKKYGASEEDPEDLISIGTIGLLKAVSSFKQDYGSRFATYAIRCIDNEMLMYFRSRKKSRREVSLYEPVGTDREGNQIRLVDVLEHVDEDVVEDMEKERFLEIIKRRLPEALTKREYEIITKRYGICGQKELTQREIAARIGISRSYVSRIEKKALEKLRKLLTE